MLAKLALQKVNTQTEESPFRGNVSHLHHDAEVFDIILLCLDQLIEDKPEQGERERKGNCSGGKGRELVQRWQNSHSSSHSFGSLLQLRISGLDGGGLLWRGERGEAGIRSWFQSLERGEVKNGTFIAPQSNKMILLQ